MRGRKPAAATISILKGQKARPGRREISPAAVRPECPEYLDEIATKEWHRIIPQLEALGVLAQIDGAALAIYCDSFSILLRANKEIQECGMLITSNFDAMKPNPAVSMAASARKVMLSVLTEFGCTPASRSRVKVKDEGRTQDTLGLFLAAKKKDP